MHIIWPSIIHMYIYTIYIIYIILFGLYRFACLEISRTSIILVNVARVYLYIYERVQASTHGGPGSIERRRRQVCVATRRDTTCEEPDGTVMRTPSTESSIDRGTEHVRGSWSDEYRAWRTFPSFHGERDQRALLPIFLPSFFFSSSSFNHCPRLSLV